MLSPRGRVSRFTAIDLSSDQFTAVHLTAARSGVKVGARVCLDIPPDIEPSDDEWIGKWMARTMKEHRFGPGPVVFVVPRQSVGLKHLVLPSTRLDELPGMVAIKMAGQLPFPAAGSIIDYAAVRESEDESEVIAAAAREELIDRYKSLAKAGGFKIDRIALRPLATGALIAEMSRERSGSLLAIDLRRYGEVELVVACDGRVCFARATEVISASEKVDRHEEARRLATEAKRSWMSYRATEESPDVEHIVVIGNDGLAGGVATEVRTLLGRPTEVLLSHPKVSGDTATLGPAWPLVGVGLAAAEGADSIDFFQPKKAPDLAAHRRQRVLAAIAAIIIVLGSIWTAGNMHLRRLEGQLQSLTNEKEDLLPAFLRYEHDRLRLEHLSRWEKARFDWLDHLAFVSEHLPQTQEAILGSFSASMNEPVMRRKDGKWLAVETQASLQFSGAAVTRPIADAIRAAFVSLDAYRTEPIVADTSSNDKTYTEAFGLRLVTPLLRPPAPNGASQPLASNAGAAAPEQTPPAQTGAPAAATAPEQSAPQKTTAPTEETSPAGGRGRRSGRRGSGG